MGKDFITDISYPDEENETREKNHSKKPLKKQENNINIIERKK